MNSLTKLQRLNLNIELFRSLATKRTIMEDSHRFNRFPMVTS